MLEQDLSDKKKKKSNKTRDVVDLLRGGTGASSRPAWRLSMFRGFGE